MTQTLTAGRRLVRVAQALKAYPHLSPFLLRQMAQRGEVTAYQSGPGRIWLFDLDDLGRAVEASRVRVTD